ncbi:MAG: hypothetical protein CMH28_00820 [Micavibrio sp.]|nr:hypothetical protein [Micavibrio sp.]|tara:strand:- start:16 stop:216 length:201 start_codon:yes stop_codon:yes gene_type:complete
MKEFYLENKRMIISVGIVFLIVGVFFISQHFSDKNKELRNQNIVREIETRIEKQEKSFWEDSAEHF